MVVTDKTDLIKQLKNAVLEADYDAAPEITKKALDLGVEAKVLMRDALSAGIKELERKLFGDYKSWVHPDFLIAMEGVRKSLEVINPEYDGDKGTVVIGTPVGDTHDLGGKMVALALTSEGFKVVYLGRDVPPEDFIDQVRANNANILALSSYQSSGFKKIEEILSMLEDVGLKDKVKVMIGGTVITEKYAERLNVGYAKHAYGAVDLAYEYMGR